MKKKIQLLFIIIPGFLYGQNFPGTEVHLLVNKDIKVKEKHKDLKKYGYDSFYITDEFIEKYDCCEKFNSKYSSLVGKEFKVLSYEPYINIIGDQKYKLKIKNRKTGIIYFDYDPRAESFFPFEVIGELDVPKDFYCKDIKLEKEKFTGQILYSSAYSEGISFTKVIKDNSTKIFMTINFTVSQFNLDTKGLILNLKNEKKIERPNIKIEVKPYDGLFTYSAFIELSKLEIELILENEILSRRIYIYDGEIKTGARLSEYLKCLTK